MGALLTFTPPGRAWTSSGTEGAAFLNIPVGGRPASLGSAYTAQATDAYAPTWNAGGLGFLESTQVSAMYLSYLESIKYQYLSVVHPLRQGRSLGLAIQYLGSGDIDATDINGNSIGSFSSHYAAYSLAYGQTITERLSLGVAGKLIHARISDVSANAYALDFGSLYKVQKNLALGMVLTNVGTSLKFMNEGDSLPLTFRAGAAYTPIPHWNLSLEGVYHKTGLAGLHTGVEWNPLDLISIRAGYRTDTLKELSPIAGLATGMGIHVWGHEFAYAWMPYGDLGNTQYFSLVARFGKAKPAQDRLTHIPKASGREAAKAPYLLPAYWETERVSPVIAQPEANPDSSSPPRVLHVLFQYENRRAKKVELVGDFNHWTPEPMVQDERGVWVLVKDIPEGKYRYNYQVDGKEMADPWNRQAEQNGRRKKSSVLQLGPSKEAQVAPSVEQESRLAPQEADDLLSWLEEEDGSLMARAGQRGGAR